MATSLDAAPPMLGLAARRTSRLLIAVDDTPSFDFVEPAELPELLLANPGTILVDVRSEEEWADGRLSRAKHIPATEWFGEADGLQGAAAALLESSDPETRLVFHCMYSRERAPQAAMAAAHARPELNIAILRGGFQQCMAQLWDANENSELFEAVVPDRWVKTEKQGLVWAPDADPSAHVAALLAANTPQTPSA